MSAFDRLFTFMTKPLVIILYLLMVALSFRYLDKPVAEYLFKLSPKGMMPWLTNFTHLGIGITYLLGFLATALFLRYVYKNREWEIRAWFLWVSVIVSVSISLVLKVMLGRARPDLWFSAHIYGFHGFHTSSFYWSFPSGHTATIMSVAFGLAVIMPRYGLITMLFGVLVAVSRILLIKHYLSDVLIAAWIALVSVGYVRWVFFNRVEIKDKTNSLFKTHGITKPSKF